MNLSEIWKAGLIFFFFFITAIQKMFELSDWNLGFGLLNLFILIKDLFKMMP